MKSSAGRLDRHSVSTRDTIHHALLTTLSDYLPAGTYRDFYAWALASANPRQQDFLRAIALDRLAVLTDSLLGSLCEPDEWPELLRYAIPVNIYQIFEVMSDNLGLGQFGNESDVSAQRHLAANFNRLVIEDLQSPSTKPTQELLAPLQQAAAAVSTFEQSLASKLHRQTAQDYVATVGNTSIGELDRGVWHGLVANVESGRHVLDVVRGTHSEWLIRQGTIDRYSGVNRTLSTHQLPRLERAVVGSHTIMVVPTLSYFTAVFAEIVGHDPVYRRTVNDGSLFEVLADAALLVRLQNDIGTPLLDMSEPNRARLLRKLPNCFPANESVDSALALIRRAASHEPAFNRFYKDLHNGEYNICLAELYSAADVDEGLAALIDSLNYFSSLYHEHKASFINNLRALNARLRDRRICALISRFVAFHQQMYTRPYDDGAGDYAV